MPLFSRSKKDTAPTTTPTEAGGATKQAAPHDRDLSSVLISPRVSEKAVAGTQRNVYTFNIRTDATKYDVRDAVISLFNVTPVKVHIVTNKPRTKVSRMRGRTSHVPGIKKAYVYLKDGDTINLV